MPPKKFDNKSFAAKPTIRPPTPPNANRPEILKPNSCISISRVIITTITLIILMTISYVSVTNAASSSCVKLFKKRFQIKIIIQTLIIDHEMVSINKIKIDADKENVKFTILIFDKKSVRRIK